MSDDKRGKATDEDSDLSCDHGPRMLLKTQPEMENETFDGGEVNYQACPATLCFFFSTSRLFFLLVSVVI